MASKMVAKKKILFFSKYMSSTQYKLWYNQIFAGFLMTVDDLLEKLEISLGNTQNMQNFGNFLLPNGHF